MGQCFCMTNWQKGSLKMKTSVHMKRLFEHFLKRFHHFARSLTELVLKQRLDILAFTTVCPSPVRSCLCRTLSLHWRNGLELAAGGAALKPPVGESGRTGMQFPQEMPEQKGSVELLGARNLDMAIPSFTIRV